MADLKELVTFLKNYFEAYPDAYLRPGDRYPCTRSSIGYAPLCTLAEVLILTGDAKGVYSSLPTSYDEIMPAVYKLQTRLKEKGLYPGKIDGLFGKLTAYALYQDVVGEAPPKVEKEIEKGILEIMRAGFEAAAKRLQRAIAPKEVPKLPAAPPPTVPTVPTAPPKVERPWVSYLAVAALAAIAGYFILKLFRGGKE
ncbi:MAG TPA: peptidoglycan-binding protein [Candidatus Desulfofervidus auxilii]|uniref:Peptidoglycan-binding protein n=1 Tax=Desulfofervidus auxilii TaxID=1621989 RepID=A0A7C0Y9Y2_DESA2|nr:peptidoglycan-binding protein [Candidatus Desulfofervidus auxilii]